MDRYKADEYTYRVFWSEEDKAWVSTCAEFKSLSNISDLSLHDALAGMVELLRDVLDDIYEEGEEPPAPFSKRAYSGHISVRMPPEKHRMIAIESAEQNVSINQLIVARV